MIWIPTEQQPAVMPTAARVAPVMSGLADTRQWTGSHAGPCIGANPGTNGFTAERSTRHLGRPST